MVDEAQVVSMRRFSALPMYFKPNPGCILNLGVQKRSDISPEGFVI